MGKLIISEGLRMTKTLCFRIFMIFCAAYGAITVISEYIDVTGMRGRGFEVDLAVDYVVFSGCITVFAAGAVFAAMFIGREYSDGTVRNKLVVGHGRCGIYLANFILCAAANVGAMLLNFLVTLVLGIPLLGMKMSVGELMFSVLMSIIACIAVTSLQVLIPMLIGKKAAAAAAAIIFIFFGFGVTSFVDSRLKEPEYWSGMEMVITEEGEAAFKEQENTKNPYYLDEDTRKVFEFIDDFLPTSQLYHIASLETPELAKTVVYDIIILIAVTEAGILVFRKKDIK